MFTILQFRPRVLYAASESNSKKLPPWVWKHYVKHYSAALLTALAFYFCFFNVLTIW
jgi:branched-subunit amino acid transport protein